MVAFVQISFTCLPKGRYFNGNWIITKARYVEEKMAFLELLILNTYMSKP